MTRRIVEHLRLQKSDRDLVARGIAVAAILLFVGTGSTVVPEIVRSIAGTGPGPDPMLANAMILNIALIVFGWRRHRQLRNEIAERAQAEMKARTLAETDPLTGCLNRRSMDRAVAALLEGTRDGNGVVALLMVDLDNFKQLNDYHGHAAGDAMLKECARRISACMPDSARLARLGGDEFACAFVAAGNQRNSVDRIADTIVRTIAAPFAFKDLSLRSTVSVGVALSDMKCLTRDDQSPAKALTHMADVAMYHAKGQGRNCHYWFEEPMEDELAFRKRIEAGIRAGVKHGEFVPYYEKQIDLRTGKLTGFEVLARWDSPELGIVNPEVFIPVAEEIGAIADLSESVIRQALNDAREWDASLSLAVNISPLQLRDPWFAQKLLKLLLNANFPPERFEIEITESCLHEHVTVVRTLIASLRNQGIRVTLDDFGTGYSSLGQLRMLAFDRLKIDRKFISEMPNDRDAALIVQGIAMIGKGLGLPVTAEGIEDIDVLDQLRDFDSFKGQGYLYGKPQPADVVRHALAENGLLVETSDNRFEVVAKTDAPSPRSMPDLARRTKPIRVAGNG